PAFDCLMVNRACRICFVLLASASKSIRIPRLEPRTSAARKFAITMADLRSDICGGWYRAGRNASSLSQNYAHRMDVETAAGWCAEHNWLDHFCWINSFQCPARFQLPAWRIRVITRFFPRSRLGDAHRHVRLLGL